MSAQSRYLILVLVLAAALRFHGIDFGLPGKFRPDEEITVNAVLAFEPFNFNPRHFNYPALFFYLVGLVMLLLRWIWQIFCLPPQGDLLALSLAQDGSPYYLTARMLSALFGIGTVALLAHAARRWYSPRCGVILALFLAVNPLHVRDSHFGVTDTAFGFFALLALVSMRTVWRRGWWRDELLAGVCVGMAAATKYTAVPLALCLAASHAAQLIGHPGRWRTRAFYLKPLAAGLAAAVTFFCLNPYVILDWAGFQQGLELITRLAKHGLPGVAELHGVGWTANFFLLAFGRAGAVLFGAGVTILAVRAAARRAAGYDALPALIFVAALLLIYTQAAWVPLRYFGPLIPPGLLVAGLAWRALEQALPRRAAGPILAALAILFSCGALRHSLAMTNLMARSDARIAAAQWIAFNLPKDAAIAVQGFGYGKPPLPHHMRYEFVAQSSLPPAARWGLADKHPVSFFAHGSSGAFGMDLQQRGEEIFAFKPYGSGGVFDPSDAFFAPFDGIDSARYPGPFIQVFKINPPMPPDS